MNDIILLTGNVNFTITLDPTIWIFDDRRFELSERIPEAEGLAMELEPFIGHAEPQASTTKAICHLETGVAIEIKLKSLLASYLCFAIDGKPIKEGGPALLYFADGSNKNEPIRGIQQIEFVI